jgi:hypothetical protein
VDISGYPTGFLGACAQVSGFAANYKRNGYTLLQYWGNQLHNWIPEGAVMQAPEVLGFLKNDAGDDMAIVRLSYTSPKGSGSYFETARKVSGVWVIEGNQRNYDASVSVRAVRIQDRSTNPYTPSNGPDAGKNVGWFDAYTARMHFGFNQSEPNGADVYAVRIKGPGLPANGIVLARSSACGTSDYLAFYSNDGSLPAAPTPGTAFPLPTPSAGNRYTFAVAPMGDRYKGTDFYNEWRGRNADGTPVTSRLSSVAPAPGVDVSTIPPLAKYTFEVFKASSGSAVADTFSVRTATRPVAPAFAAKLPWAEFTADTMKYLDPSDATRAGELTSATLAWTVPTNAAPVYSAWVYGDFYDTSVSPPVLRRMDMNNGVAKLGDSSLTLQAAVERNGNGAACSYAKVPAFTATSGYRELGMRQSTVEGLVLMQIHQHIGRRAPM